MKLIEENLDKINGGSATEATNDDVIRFNVSAYVEIPGSLVSINITEEEFKELIDALAPNIKDWREKYGADIKLSFTQSGRFDPYTGKIAELA